jgi:hypothetical protein
VTVTPVDTVCRKCNAPVFYATAGWWLHVNWGVTCFNPAPKLADLKKENDALHSLQALPRRNYADDKGGWKRGELAAPPNANIHLRQDAAQLAQ